MDSGADANKPLVCSAPYFYNATDSGVLYYCKITGLVTVAGGSGLSGTLSTNIIPRALGPQTLGDGSLTDDGAGNVGAPFGFVLTTPSVINFSAASGIFSDATGGDNIIESDAGRVSLEAPGTGSSNGIYFGLNNPIKQFKINNGTGTAPVNLGGGVTTVGGLIAPNVGIAPVGADPSGATDSYTAIQAAITAAISAGKCVALPIGTYKVSAGLVAASNSFCMSGAGASVTSITASGSGYNTLIIGPGSVTYVGPNGHLSDITLVGNSRTSDGHSALQLNGTVQYDVSRVTVDTADIGIDLINNNYGTQFTDIRGGFAGDLNVGFNLRTGSQSGSDLTFNNPWISGVTAAIYAAGGGGGYHVWGGQLGAGIGRSSTCDACGAIVLGKDYLTAATGETTMDVYGTSFEGTNDTWIFRAFNQVNLNTYGVYANPSDVSHPAIGFFKGESLGNARMNIDGTVLSGFFSAANLVSLAGGNAGFKFWNETFTYTGASNPTINGSVTYVFSMGAQSGLLQQAAVIDSNISRVFHAEQYPGATVDVQVNACLADALAAAGTCDARALGSTNVVANGHPNPQVLNAQIVVGDNNGDPVTLLLPASFWWEGTMTDGTSCDVKQFSGTSIIGANAASASNSIAAFVSSTTSSLQALFCVVQSTGQGAGNYVYDYGFEVNNGQYTGFGAATVSGAAMLLQAGHLDDNTTFDHVDAASQLDTYVVELTNSLCCSTTFRNFGANGLDHSIPMYINAAPGFGMSTVNIVDSSIVHNGNGPIFLISDTSSNTSTVNIQNVYSEVKPNADGIMKVSGFGGVRINNWNLKAYSGSMTSPGIHVDNTLNTWVSADNLVFSNGSGSWTQPCASAIVDDFLGETLPCQYNTKIGWVSHWDSGTNFNNIRLVGGKGLGTNAKNLAIGDSTTLSSTSFTGQNDVVTGAGSGTAITSGSSDVFNGTGILPNCILCANLTASGTNAGTGGVSQTTSTNGIFYGDATGAQADGLANFGAVGHGATVVASNTYTYGNASVTDDYFGSNGATQLSNSNIHAKSVFESDGGFTGSSQLGGAAACETTFGITTLNTGATTTDTGLNCLPSNAVIDAVVYRVTTAITTSASFTIGDATTAARFCSTQSTLTLGTTGVCFVQADQTGAAGPRQASQTKVRVTLNANPGAGAIRLIVYYHTWTTPTS